MQTFKWELFKNFQNFFWTGPDFIEKLEFENLTYSGNEQQAMSQEKESVGSYLKCG